MRERTVDVPCAAALELRRNALGRAHALTAAAESDCGVAAGVILLLLVVYYAPHTHTHNPVLARASLDSRRLNCGWKKKKIIITCLCLCFCAGGER